MSVEKFKETIAAGYPAQGAYITLGGAMYEGAVIKDLLVNIPLKNLNRHGLIAGATGTGKTKTLQALTENLSKAGVPTLLMDLKGDLSGIAAIGEEKSFIKERHAQMNLPYTPEAFPVELLTISKQDGVRLRATVSEFGSVLLSRILDLSDVQEGVLAVIFKYCDDHQYPLLDLKDLKKVLQYATEEGKSEFEAEYGRVASSSTSAILRKIVELENQGAELFFGERSFETEDLLRTDEKGRGTVNIIRLTDIQDRPKMFSTFMLCLLAEIYNTFPEIGDQEKPKLIRSKGVGLIFCTQTPTDVPDSVLSQLGMKIQHALRAFTAKDRQAIKLTAQNYPETTFYNVAEYLTSLGTGEAFVTALDAKGRPTPLVATMMRAPMSRMDILSESEIAQVLAKSALKKKYNEEIDRESAYEILNAKIANAAEAAAKEQDTKSTTTRSATTKTTEPKTPAPKRSTAQNPVVKLLTSATFIRGVFGVLSKLMKK